MFDNISVAATPPLSVQEITADNVQISPNPVISTLNVHFNGTSEKVMYRVYSSEGKLIKQFDNEDPEATLDLKALNSGIYYLSIHGFDDHFITSKKFIKQ